MLQDEESDDISDKTLQKMTAIIGEENQQYTLPLLHLVIADSAYCDANKDEPIGVLSGIHLMGVMEWNLYLLGLYKGLESQCNYFYPLMPNF